MDSAASTGTPDDNESWGEDGLTLKQRRFCEFYVSQAAGNGTMAARLAGYQQTAQSLGQQARENLQKPHVRAYIGRLMARLGMTPEFLKSRLTELACSNYNNITTITDDGEVVVDLRMAAEMGALGQIKETCPVVVTIKGVEKVMYRVKMHDPQKSIETLLRLYGTLFDSHKHTVTGKDDGPIQVQGNPLDLSKLSEEELVKMADLVAKAGR